MSNTLASTTLPPLWVRIVHWINVFAFVTMLLSGWQIYNADPFWISSMPKMLALGGSLPGALQWHFAAMWILVGNGAIAIALLIVSGRLRTLYLSIRLRTLRAEIRQFIEAPLKHEHGQRNAVQKMTYLAVLLLLSMEVLSGLGMWKPVQFQVLTNFFGGYESTRRVHFVGMSSLGLFMLGHIVLAILSPQLLLAMLGIKPHAQTTTEKSK